jgi:hypothetical protein
MLDRGTKKHREITSLSVQLTSRISRGGFIGKRSKLALSSQNSEGSLNSSANL